MIVLSKRVQITEHQNKSSMTFIPGIQPNINCTHKLSFESFVGSNFKIRRNSGI